MDPWIDVTWTTHPNMPVWPGESRPLLDRVATVEADGMQVTQLSMSVHTGTHIDAPRHFIADGNTIDQVPLEKLVGPCLFIDYQGDGPFIGATDLEEFDWQGVHRVVFRTKNSLLPMKGQFRSDYVSLSLDAAEFLVAQGIELVGIDYLSVEAFDAAPGFPVHTVLLDAGVVVVEWLKLKELPPGNATYELMALPMLLAGSDGSPARVLMRRL